MVHKAKGTEKALAKTQVQQRGVLVLRDFSSGSTSIASDTSSEGISVVSKASTGVLTSLESATRLRHLSHEQHMSGYFLQSFYFFKLFAYQFFRSFVILSKYIWHVFSNCIKVLGDMYSPDRRIVRNGCALRWRKAILRLRRQPY